MQKSAGNENSIIPSVVEHVDRGRMASKLHLAETSQPSLGLILKAVATAGLWWWWTVFDDHLLASA
jgi:hypothetical protein